MSRRAAARIAGALRREPRLLLGGVTGDTPTRTYARLAEMRTEEPDLFRRVRVLKLDEWMGLPAGHPATSERYFRTNVLGPLGIPRSRYQGFATRPPDLDAECARIARWLGAHGPMDLCVLGLGTNGHLLFNEPAPSLPPGPHVARLSRASRRHAMVRAMKRPPTQGLTVGLADILAARAVLLLVSGRHKAAPLRRMIEGGVTTRCPASLLWLHPDVTVYCDEFARGEI
jgi:galactosamine-6-phosphate isomerase